MILATQETEAGISQVQGQPWQLSQEPVSNNNNKKCGQAGHVAEWYGTPGSIPSTKQTKVWTGNRNASFGTTEVVIKTIDWTSPSK